MKDEEFVFRQDVKEKSSTARNARYRRTHNGKGGRVKFPSDNLSRKDLQAMNGEVKTYRLNDPMKWDEFKALPDDLKIVYIKALRKKFNVPFVYIGNMLGCSQWKISLEVTRLGLSEGKAAKGRSKKWDKEGWVAWCNGAPLPATDPVEETPAFSEEVEQAVESSFEEDAEKGLASLEDICEPVPVPEVKVLPVCEEKRKAIPNCGTMTFEGSVESILNTISVLLGGGRCTHQCHMGCAF